MWDHVLSVAALALLCSCWVLFQGWLERLDPDGRRIEDAKGCGGGCSAADKRCRSVDPHADGRTGESESSRRCDG